LADSVPDGMFGILPRIGTVTARSMEKEAQGSPMVRIYRYEFLGSFGGEHEIQEHG